MRIMDKAIIPMMCAGQQFHLTRKQASLSIPCLSWYALKAQKLDCALTAALFMRPCPFSHLISTQNLFLLAMQAQLRSMMPLLEPGLRPACFDNLMIGSRPIFPPPIPMRNLIFPAARHVFQTPYKTWLEAAY